MNVFHTIYYINLDRSKDRREYMEKTFSNLHRVEGVDGRNLKIEKSVLKRCKMSVFQIGCLHSHFKAIKTAYDNGDEEALIMEDDIHIDFINNWEKNITQIVKNKPKDADCIQLHCSNLKQVKKILKMCSDYNEWKKGRFSTGCYYITRKGMNEILKLGLNYIPNYFCPADHFIYKKIKTYNYTRPLFNLNERDSTLIWQKKFRINYDKKLFKGYFANINLLKRIRRNISFLQNKINENIKIFKITKNLRKKHQIKIKLVKLMQKFIINNKRFDRIIS